MSWTILPFVLTAILSAFPGASAQISSNVQCSASYSWALNSRQQTPCLVAAYLQGACSDGEFAIQALPPSSHYVGPSVASANPCQCSSVVYSLISACADCQNRTFIGWREWNTNCSSPYLRLFPVDIPSATVVPAWAYLDVGTTDLYNAAIAKADINAPESSASGATSTRGTATATASGAARTTSSSSGGTNVGAIAGGVVGGVVVIGLLVGLAVFFFLRRRRARTAPSAAYGSVPAAGRYPSPPPTSQYSSTPFSPGASDMTSLGGVPKLYDPADPSTYPTAPGSPTLHTTGSFTHFDPNYGGHPSPPPRGAYSGAPEI